MIVKSFLLRPERATSIAALCPAGTIAVIRPESRIEGLFRDAIRAAIVEKNPSGAPYDAIRAYFDAFSGDAAYRRIVEDTLHGLSSYLGEGMYVQTSAAAIEDYVMAKCTRLCAEAVASRLGAPLVGGTQLMICHEGGARPFVDWTLSRAQISQRLAGLELVVVPGGYGRLDSGYVVRIGRGGAHLMASLIASATGADCVEYYVEEDGIAGLPAMSYDEAAHYCASSAAPFPSAALWPAKRDSIPIKVLNICNPDFPGTVISEAGSPSGPAVSGVLCDSGLELLTVYGTGLLGQIGMSSAVFSAMAGAGVNVRFIAQTSSEYSISFAVAASDRDKAVDAVSSLVVSNPHMPQDDVMVLDSSVAILTVFGDKMKKVPGVSAKVYDALGKAGISVVASAQGGEELSISVAVAAEDALRAQNALESLT